MQQKDTQFKPKETLIKKAFKILGLGLFVILLTISILYLYLGYAPKPRSPKLSATIQQATIKIGNLERSYSFYLPKNLASNAPLVFVFHGSLQDAEAMRISTGYEFERLAEEEKFVVVYPNGYKNNWNDCRKIASYPARTMNIDDKSFVAELINKFSNDYKIDIKRVFATGYSNGGHLAYRLALEMPNKITAIAAIAASFPTPNNNDCQESKQAVPVMIINGKADPINPYNGGKVTLFGFGNRGTVLSSIETAKYFAQFDKEITEPIISSLPNQKNAPPTVEKYDYQSKVILYAVNNGGHVVPQSIYNAPRILGKTSQTFNAPAEIWKFFAQQTSLK
jgi:polyhydroxybutyrate depolymerase